MVLACLLSLCCWLKISDCDVHFMLILFFFSFALCYKRCQSCTMFFITILAGIALLRAGHLLHSCFFFCSCNLSYMVKIWQIGLWEDLQNVSLYVISITFYSLSMTSSLPCDGNWDNCGEEWISLKKKKVNKIILGLHKYVCVCAFLCTVDYMGMFMDVTLIWRIDQQRNPRPEGHQYPLSYFSASSTHSQAALKQIGALIHTHTHKVALK